MPSVALALRSWTGRAWLPAVLAALLLPGAGQAAPSAEFQLTVPSPCYALLCDGFASYDASAAGHPVVVDIDWDHPGAPEVGFVADDSRTCGVPQGPYVEPFASMPVACQFSRRSFTTPGSSSVALRVTDLDGTVSYAARPLTVLPYPRREATADRTPTKGGRPSRGGAGVHPLCADVPAGVTCQDGGGRQTPGGGELVSHEGWPKITGVFWQVKDGQGRRKDGGPDNDELLGHHGSDTLLGNGGRDVLWGDWDPKNNNTWQKDVLRGGAGNDQLYPSHGASRVYGGPGNDRVWAFYGKGTIDCGPGKDRVRVRLNGAFKLRNCETIGHFCAHGPDGKGGCKKPGEYAVAAHRATRR